MARSNMDWWDKLWENSIGCTVFFKDGLQAGNTDFNPFNPKPQPVEELPLEVVTALTGMQSAIEGLNAGWKQLTISASKITKKLAVTGLENQIAILQAELTEYKKSL